MRYLRGRRGWPHASLELLLNDCRSRRLGGECGRHKVTRESGEGQRERRKPRNRLREKRKGRRLVLVALLSGLLAGRARGGRAANIVRLVGSRQDRLRAQIRAGFTRGFEPRGAHDAIFVADSSTRRDATVQAHGSGQGGRHRFGFFARTPRDGLWECVRTEVKTPDLGVTEFRAMQRRRRSRSLVACRCPAQRY